MTKSNITQYDNTAANNTDVEDVPLGENLMYPSHVNNAFREMMADLADVNDGTVALTSPSATALDVTNNITVGGTVDGRDVAADGTKLDGIEASATADQTASEIKTAYESNSDTNEFSDAEQTKLAGIEAAADVTDTTNVTAAGAAMLTGATMTGDLTVPNVSVTSGVYLGGTGSANKLDDYEEGTWTPQINGVNMSNTSRCTYTKVGRHVTLMLDATSPGGSASSNAITNLPFTNPSANYGAFHCAYSNGTSGIQGGYVNLNSTTLLLIVAGSSSADQLVAGNRIIGVIHYFTA